MTNENILFKINMSYVFWPFWYSVGTCNGECRDDDAILAVTVWQHWQKDQMAERQVALKGDWVYFSLPE